MNMKWLGSISDAIVEQSECMIAGQAQLCSPKQRSPVVCLTTVAPQRLS